MNILYINTNFQEGGAAKIARQLYYGMQDRGHKVYFIVGYRSKNDEECFVLNDTKLKQVYNLVTGVLQNNQVIIKKNARKTIIDFIREKKIDIVHINNIFENYIGIKDIAEISKVSYVVWTMHDMWVITGHCAQAVECDGWRKECIKCIENRKYPAFYYNDVRFKYQLKKASFTEKGIVFVSPSKWLWNMGKESILKNEKLIIIQNGINTGIYHPLNRDEVRRKYHILDKKKVLFFTAAVLTNTAKGMSYLVKAIQKLNNKDVILLTAGNGEIKKELAGFELRQMGFIESEKRMNELYNLADIYITPSFAESFGCTAVEAMATGTPVIAFASGGLSEIVTNETGWLVESRDIDGLYSAICEALKDEDALHEKSKKARERVVNLFSEKMMLDKYEELYREISGGKLCMHQ